MSEFLFLFLFWMSVSTWAFVGAAGLALLVLTLRFVVRGAHRFLLRMEERGWIYYRERPTGAGGGVFFELDRLVRPSIEHTAEVQTRVEKTRDDDGDP